MSVCACKKQSQNSDSIFGKYVLTETTVNKSKGNTGCWNMQTRTTLCIIQSGRRHPVIALEHYLYTRSIQ